MTRTIVATGLVFAGLLGAGCSSGGAALGEPKVSESGLARDYDHGSPGGETWPGHESPGDWSREISVPIEFR